MATLRERPAGALRAYGAFRGLRVTAVALAVGLAALVVVSSLFGLLGILLFVLFG